MPGYFNYDSLLQSNKHHPRAKESGTCFGEASKKRGVKIGCSQKSVDYN